MLLTVTTTLVPATDLGYLLYKDPARMQTEELSFGKAHGFYSEAEARRCTDAVLLEVDSVALVDLVESREVMSGHVLPL